MPLSHRAMLNYTNAVRCCVFPARAFRREFFFPFLLPAAVEYSVLLDALSPHVAMRCAEPIEWPVLVWTYCIQKYQW